MRKYKLVNDKRRLFDTERSTELGTRAFGNFGDPAGYEETLYQTKQGLYFVVGRGGEGSPYADGEDIRYLTDEEAAAWQA